MKKKLASVKEGALKIINSFNYTVSIKKIGVVIVTIFLFFAFNDRLVSLIENFLFVKDDFSNFWLDVLIIFSSLYVLIFIGYRYYKYKYLASFTEVYFASVLSIIIMFYYNKAENLKWFFLKDEIIKLHYIWYFLIPIFQFLFLYILKLFSRHFIYPFKNSENTNEFENDDPIFKIDKDKLGYSPIVKRLSEILVKEKHDKSFSIGLVGPWGNGKSSVINLLKKNIEDKEFLKRFGNSKKPIVVHFLPYLNHTEDDIINEFFISLSDQLSKYNGKLSNQILIYSQKLINLYSSKNKNILGIVNKHVTKTSDTPAKKLYDEINKRLIEIDQKIIVFVDDLDRLNDKEILQVLKLIRNTADFYNTVFVVAMDKQYVLDRLANNDTILNSTFVDKFFQLEVFLPEIDQVILRKYVYDILLDQLSIVKPTFSNELSSAFNNNNNLFNDYVKNFRDAKRIINQIIYDYKNFGIEIDLKDFMNFIYFKLKFPKFIKLLNDNRLDYLEINSNANIYKLKEVKKEGDEPKDVLTILRENRDINSNDYSSLKKYQLFSELLPEENKIYEEIINVDAHDKHLLIKTLAYLFGNENTDDKFNSIRKTYNFRMLMQQRVFDDLLTEQEFIDLIKDEDIIRINTGLTNLFDENKINQLINRFEYFKADDEGKLNIVIIILLQLYDNRSTLEILEHSTLDLLDKLVQVKVELHKESPEILVSWVKENIFESENIATINKINLLSRLWNFKIENQSWGLKDDYIIEKAKSLYNTYLDETESLWEVEEFSFYGAFHDLKQITSVKDYLIQQFKTFWTNNSIELLCAQTLQFGSFSTSIFNISDFENEVFENKENFYQFVQNHKDRESPEVKEFLNFLKLLSITKFEDYIKFNFKVSDLVLKRIENHKKQHGRQIGTDDYSNIKQVFFETNDKDVFYQLRKRRDLFKSNKTKFSYTFYDDEEGDINDLYYLIVQFDVKDFEKEIVLFSDKIKDALSENTTVEYKKENILNKKSFIILDDKSIYLKVISIN